MDCGAAKAITLNQKITKITVQRAWEREIDEDSAGLYGLTELRFVGLTDLLETRNCQNPFRLSNSSVTGPSFIRATSIIAPKMPRSTWIPDSATFLQTAS
jgi:hypothetical protein